jgi:hypothetical protein
MFRRDGEHRVPTKRRYGCKSTRYTTSQPRGQGVYLQSHGRKETSKLKKHRNLEKLTRMAVGYHRYLGNTERLVFFIYFLACFDRHTTDCHKIHSLLHCHSHRTSILTPTHVLNYRSATTWWYYVVIYARRRTEPHTEHIPSLGLRHESCFCTKMAGCDSLNHAG